MNHRPDNPNRQLTIILMMVAAYITLTIVSMSIATLSGDSPETAFGKALLVVPIIVVIFLVLFSIYYYRDVWLSKISLPAQRHQEPEPVPDNNLDMLRKIKQVTGERDAVRAELVYLQETWNSLFGEAGVAKVKVGIENMYAELESLRAADSGKLAQLQEENLTKTLAAQELAEKLRESQSKTTQALTQNEELLQRLNQATLKITLLEGEKSRLLSIAKQQTWREVDWEEFMNSVNFGESLLTDNRWGERIRQRVRKEGLVLFGDPTVTALASQGDLPELVELNHEADETQMRR